MSRGVSMALALLPMAGRAACGGAGPPSAPHPPATTCPITPAVAAPTFRADILPRLLRQSCGATSTTSCHGGNAPPGHVSYDPARTESQVYAALVGAPPASAPAGWLLVAPGDLTRSWIVEKVTKDQPGGTGYGARMPYGAPDLCADTLQTLESWILAGAAY
jgi:hypothetical protein